MLPLELIGANERVIAILAGFSKTDLEVAEWIQANLLKQFYSKLCIEQMYHTSHVHVGLLKKAGL